MMQLSVRLVPVDDTTLVIALTGELDCTTRPVLAAFLDPLPRTSVKHVLVAAGDLWFCDLNGLEQLAITHRALQEKGGHLALAEVRPSLRRLITLMAEHSLGGLPVFDSMPEALAAAGVEAYQTPSIPALRRRHLPRLRTAHTPDRPRRESASPSPRPAGEEVIELPPLPEPVIGYLPTIINESRALRERAARQQEALHRRLTLAAESRDFLLAARERCDDSLRILRASLLDARSFLKLGGSYPGSR
jgi:anti-anti-sigma factor